MKYVLILIPFTFLITFQTKTQDVIKDAPPAFDSVQTNISHGEIDTISYNATTVGTTRGRLIYTPTGYSKNKKYPVLYLSHGLSQGAKMT